jgi:8-oxo-dGTP diphosphatase
VKLLSSLRVAQPKGENSKPLVKVGPVRLTVGAIIVDDEGRAFVHRRGNDRVLFPGCWDIPGGHVEAGETLLDALAREVHEETGWRLQKVVAELGECVWTGNDGVARREVDYVVEVQGDLSAPCLEHPKHVDYAWVGLDDLDRLLENRTTEQTLVRDLVARGLAEALHVRRLTQQRRQPRTSNFTSSL